MFIWGWMLEMLRMLFISTVSILSQMLSETGENKEEAQISLVPKELLDLLNVVVRKAWVEGSFVWSFLLRPLTRFKDAEVGRLPIPSSSHWERERTIASARERLEDKLCDNFREHLISNQNLH